MVCWDPYVHADFVAYSSYWNVETVFAKLSIIVFEYLVRKTDLSAEGLVVISLEESLGHKKKWGRVTLPKGIIEGRNRSVPSYKILRRLKD